MLNLQVWLFDPGPLQAGSQPLQLAKRAGPGEAVRPPETRHRRWPCLFPFCIKNLSFFVLGTYSPVYPATQIRGGGRGSLTLSSLPAGLRGALAGLAGTR